VLETVGVEIDDRVIDRWRARAGRARAALGWPSPPPVSSAASERTRRRAQPCVVRRHASGVQLAIVAPPDQLLTATEINEWALCASLRELEPARWGSLERDLIAAAQRAAESAAEDHDAAAGEPMPHAVAFAATALPVLDDAAALQRFARLAALEGLPRLAPLVDAAAARALSCLLDEQQLTLGTGAGGRSWPLTTLPDVDAVPWSQLKDVPAVVVTGSNGKTTTVRLLAACARANGWRDGYNCTDGLYVAGEPIASGDYSGPVGTRTVLRDPRVEAAILETARGGILRRGLAVARANVAIVTNVSADHFGEYGIHDLDGLADVKLVVASAVRHGGLLVLNADDALLRAHGAQLDVPIAWFATDFDHPELTTHRARSGWTCGVREGHLLVATAIGARRSGAEQVHDLGRIADMPLTVDGSASYNVANVCGAALSAVALGIGPALVADVLRRFGADPADNPGRLMRYAYRGAQVLVDYAHNPEGLAGLLDVARHLRGGGRVALLLGQAGNREDADIRRLAGTAAAYRPDLVVVKETERYLRGRAEGEVPAILRAELLASGVSEASIEMRTTELDAARRALDWARPGDVLVLPVHDRASRTEVLRILAEGRGASQAQ
jgi:cyanophycin synthetase